MNAPTKLGAYTLVLVAALGSGAALGAAVGPIDVGTDEHVPGGHERLTGTPTERPDGPAEHSDDRDDGLPATSEPRGDARDDH